MILEEFKKLEQVNGVIRISDVDDTFEKIYLNSRAKEKRIYTDDEIKLLPYASTLNPHKSEWAIRARSFLRFRKYFSRKKSRLNVLDLGSGNGWMTGQLAKEFDHNYYCVDINLHELEQAARVFCEHNITFIYADLLTTSFPNNVFDIVIVNSALQYFQNISTLIKEIFFITKSYGEIHIIDSPFYKNGELINARNRTLKYYQSIGIPEMTKYYYHHSISELKYLRYSYLYNPYSFKKKLTDLFFEKDSPFPWIVVTR